MFPRNLLRYRVRNGVMHPQFLCADNPEHVSIGERAIHFYESNMGKDRGSVPFHELRMEVGDDRLADGLRYALRHLYPFAPRWSKSSIGSTPLNLRLRLFRYVGAQGFAEDRHATLRTFIEACGGELKGMNVEELESHLWSDDPRGHQLTRMKNPVGPGDVIQHYNYEVLDTILSNARVVCFTTRGGPIMPKGTFAKRVVREVKQLGLIYEARLQGDAVSVDVYGPIELFGRPTRFAWRLSALFNRALPILKDAGEWSVRVMVHMRRGDLPCILTHESLPEFASDVQPEEDATPMFDSLVEQKFYNVMSCVDKYRVEREAEPIIVGDTLVVSDYVFERPDGVRWHLEIIGFWRPEYTAKKRAKLDELRKAGFERLILLVDHNQAKHFKDLGFPTYTYRMRGNKLDAPYGRIVSLILS